MHNLKNKKITSDKMAYLISLTNTVKPLNTGHSWSLKCCSVFGGVQYSEGSVCIWKTSVIWRCPLEMSVRRGSTVLQFLQFHSSTFLWNCIFKLQFHEYIKLLIHKKKLKQPNYTYI